MEHVADALIVLADGRISAFGPYADLAPTIPAGVETVAYGNALIPPGLIDTHVHHPQLQVIASYGAQLLAWLDRYTFPAELQFADLAHAESVAKLFFREIPGAGTTTAAVHCTVHPGCLPSASSRSRAANRISDEPCAMAAAWGAMHASVIWSTASAFGMSEDLGAR